MSSNLVNNLKTALFVMERDFKDLGVFKYVNEVCLECGDQELRLGGELKDQLSDGLAVLRIQSVVKLVQDVERRSFHLEHCKDECNDNHSLLST